MVAALLTFPFLLSAAFFVGCVVAFFVVRQSRLFRDYADLKDDLRGIARRLGHGTIARDKVDLLVSGELENVPFSIRFSHSETAPGMYIRCSAQADFSLTFESYTTEPADPSEVCRTGDSVFDRRFLGRTDNRVLAKQLLSQPGFQEHLQRLCCSNKTMLRIAEDAVELSEALIPDDTQQHVVSHLESLVILSGMLNRMRTRGRTQTQTAGHRSFWPIRIAVAAAMVLVAVGIFLFRTPGTTVDATSQNKLSQPAQASAALEPKFDGWTQAQVKDFNADFLAWAQRSGAVPLTRVTLDGNAGGDAGSVVYFLRPEANGKVKRVVWMHGSKVVFDMVGPVDGIIRIPKEALSAISWQEGTAPAFTPDGDGLLVVRDQSKPASATVYFTSEQVLHTAVPADFAQISLL